MKLGIISSLWGVAGIPLGESLRRAAQHGFRFVDVFGRWHGDPRHLSRSERAEAVRIAKDLGITIPSLVSLFPRNPASPEPKIQKENWAYFEACMDWAEELGAKKLIYIAGERERDLLPAEAWKHSVAFAQRCAEAAQARGFALILEFEPTAAALVSDLEKSLRFIQAVDSPAFLFNIDTGHANVVRAGARELRPLGPYTVHAHLSDNGGLFDAHDALGTGNAPNKEYLEELAALDIDRQSSERGLGPAVVSIEINFGLVAPNLRPDPDVTAARALSYVESVMPSLLASLGNRG